jgi:predicted Na+-dependent transporter
MAHGGGHGRPCGSVWIGHPRSAPGDFAQQASVAHSWTVSRLTKVLSGYPELLIVLVAAAIGLTVQPPLAWLTSHNGINALLVVLVFSTAVTIEPSALRRISTSWRPLSVTLAVGATVLPALSWLMSRVVSAGSLRDGVMCIGLAPCEIASVATTAMAEGEAALSAGILIGSTVMTVAIAGPILAIEAGHASVHPAHIVLNLLLVVVLPLVVGLALGAVRPLGDRAQRTALVIATISVAALVALVAAEIHFSEGYVAVVGALVLFVVGSIVIGRLIGWFSPSRTASSILLTTSMRDFAIAAGLATAAFGASAAAPLGLYGVVVLLWGTGAAGWLRQRS